MRADVVAESAVVAHDLADATIAWSNDYAWPREAQLAVEELAHAHLPKRSVLCLYRPPLLSVGPAGTQEGAWEDGGRLRVATSWSPECEMHLVVKR